MWCQGLIGNAQGQPCTHGISPLLQRSCCVGHRCARDRPHLAGEPQNGEEIAAVRLDIDIDDIFAEVINERGSKWGRWIKDQDAVTVIGCVELLAGAEHPLGGDPHLLSALNASTVGHLRANKRYRNALSGGNIASAADNVEDWAIADADLRKLQTISFRMRSDLEELANDHLVPVGTPALHAANLKASQGQRVRQLLGGQLNVGELAEPGERNLHRKPAKKRRSFSRKARRSGIPCRNIAMRSTPRPNANPWWVSGSMPPFSSTTGCTIPAPRMVIQPSLLPGHETSTATDGSVNG